MWLLKYTCGAGIGPEISESVKDIYNAANVSLIIASSFSYTLMIIV